MDVAKTPEKRRMNARAKSPLPSRGKSMSVIGLDIGHSAVKVTTGQGENIIFPTAAAPALELGVAEAMGKAKADTVEIAGQTYFVGETALTHTNSQTLDGLSDGWIETVEHLALLKSGYQRGLEQTGEADSHLILGLPSRLHLTQQKRLTELAAMHLGISANKVTVIPQPLGAYMHSVLDENGEPTGDFTQETWGVIDIGFYTADYGLIKGGVWSAAGAQSSGGANKMAEMLMRKIKDAHKQELTLRQCDEILRTRSTKLFGKVTPMGDLVDEVAEAYARQVLDFGTRVFGSALATMDGVLVAGGGSDLIFKHIKNAWPHAATIKNPRFAVAEGLRRYGSLITSAASA